MGPPVSVARTVPASEDPGPKASHTLRFSDPVEPLAAEKSQAEAEAREVAARLCGSLRQEGACRRGVAEMRVTGRSRSHSMT